MRRKHTCGLWISERVAGASRDGSGQRMSREPTLAGARFVLIAALVFVAACGRREPPARTSAASDSLRAVAVAESALVAGVSKLQWWVERWSRFLPGFTLDSLRPVKVGRLPSPENRVTTEWWEGERDRELFGVPSPDSGFIAHPDLARSYSDGEVQLSPEPDSWAVVIDTKTDSVTTLERCGTLCLFERTVWLGPRLVVLTQLNEDWQDSSSGWGELTLFDLDRRIRVDFRTPRTSNLADARAATREELEAHYRDRVRVLAQLWK